MNDLANARSTVSRIAPAAVDASQGRPATFAGVAGIHASPLRLITEWALTSSGAPKVSTVKSVSKAIAAIQAYSRMPS